MPGDGSGRRSGTHSWCLSRSRRSQRRVHQHPCRLGRLHRHHHRTASWLAWPRGRGLGSCLISRRLHLCFPSCLSPLASRSRVLFLFRLGSGTRCWTRFARRVRRSTRTLRCRGPRRPSLGEGSSATRGWACQRALFLHWATRTRRAAGGGGGLAGGLWLSRSSVARSPGIPWFRESLWPLHAVRGGHSASSFLAGAAFAFLVVLAGISSCAGTPRRQPVPPGRRSRGWVHLVTC